MLNVQCSSIDLMETTEAAPRHPLTLKKYLPRFRLGINFSFETLQCAIGSCERNHRRPCTSPRRTSYHHEGPHRYRDSNTLPETRKLYRPLPHSPHCSARFFR